MIFQYTIKLLHQFQTFKYKSNSKYNKSESNHKNNEIIKIYFDVQQVLEYYHYLWQRTRGVSPDLLLQNLPPSLRTTVCQYMYSANISTCLKALNYNKRFVVEERDKKGFYRLLSSYIKPIICMTGNVICRFVITSQS